MSSRAAAKPLALDVVADRVRRARAVADSLRPAYVLGPLLLAQWIAVLALAVTVKHNGWLYYAGGDQLWHYSGAYLLAHGHVPPAYVGYGWSILMLPLASLAGPNLVSALPAIVLANALVLLPVALLCVYGIAARLAGRVFGYFAAALWIALPYLGILFVEPGYHQKYTELTLPQVLGLTSLPDFPATVALLVSAYLCLRALDGRSWYAAPAAGLAAGYSIAIKPSNSIFLAAPAIIFLFERRWRLLPLFAAGLAPSLMTLAVWKFRGLGELAAAPAESMRIAGSISDLFSRIHGTKLNSWQHLSDVLDSLREHFWVARVIEWLPVAGLVALLGRSRQGFLLVGSWFVAYLLAKGTYIPASVEDASFFRIMMPSFPAYLLLASAVVLLVPGTRARPATRSFELTGRRLRVAVGAAAGVFVLLPIGIVAATPRLDDGGSDALRVAGNLIPVSDAISPSASADGNTVRISWRARPAGTASVFYSLLRTGNKDGAMACAGKPRTASDDCELFMQEAGTARGTSFVDHPGAGSWTYRVAVAANWLNDVRYGDVYVVSKPVTVTVG